jgi:hypothetical protein
LFCMIMLQASPMAFVEEALVNPVPETGEDLREEG